MIARPAADEDDLPEIKRSTGDCGFAKLVRLCVSRLEERCLRREWAFALFTFYAFRELEESEDYEPLCPLGMATMSLDWQNLVLHVCFGSSLSSSSPPRS